MRTTSNFIFISLFAVATTSFALETDQFIAGNKILNDSSEVMNQYFYENMEKAFSWANKRNPNKVACKMVALKVMDYATGTFDLSKASTFASASPLIDRYPEDSVSESGYKDQSIYENAWIQLRIVDLARTININNIHVGTDKFGHFTRMGMSYYKSYLEMTNFGMNEEEAITKSIVKGFGSELGILGYFIDGVLSYGDLEANYQGFMFALDMCRGDRPILILKDNRWQMNPDHKFTVRDYFTPQMDESFNFSFWRKTLYKRIKEKLSREYCSMKDDPIFLGRMKYYQSIYKENLNDRLVREKITSREKYSRKNEDLNSLCGNLF